MGNCLARGNLFEQEALLGRLALFSIQTGNARATLSIRPLERRGEITSYDIAQLKGPKNSSPPAGLRDSCTVSRRASQLAPSAPCTRGLQ